MQTTIYKLMLLAEGLERRPTGVLPEKEKSSSFESKPKRKHRPTGVLPEEEKSSSFESRPKRKRRPTGVLPEEE